MSVLMAQTSCVGKPLAQLRLPPREDPQPQRAAKWLFQLDNHIATSKPVTSVPEGKKAAKVPFHSRCYPSKGDVTLTAHL